MDRLTAIKIKYQDGTYSDEIPLSVLAQNIDWDDTNTIVDIIGDVDFDTDGSIQDQIDNILAQKGSVNGIATLDSNGLIPSSQLPSYVDDVLEYSTYNAFPATGETGKIYIALDTNLTYRWGGSSYVEISKSLALGETSSTAYRGDRGKVAYDHATDSNRLTTATESGFYKVATTSEGHIAGLTAVQKSDITNLGVPGSDTKNTAGSTDTSSKIFLIGATSQTDNSQTYSHDTAYVGTDGQLYSGGSKVLTTVKQDGVSGATANRFGVCSTSADTAAKTVSITSGAFNLESGSRVSVKFSNTNSANNPTLNVNGTGAKNIYVNGAQIVSGGNKALLSGTVELVYDGTNYNLIGAGNVTGVKGDKESSYRTGNINITPSNIGATMAEELTEAEYNALSESEKLEDKIFLITDSTKGQLAKEVSYDNTDSGLTATNVQAAIDEINGLSGVTGVSDRVTSIENMITNPLKPFGMKKCVFIGDSYGSRSVNWVDSLVSALGLSSSDYVTNAIGSTGFAYTHEGHNFNTMLTTVYNNASAEFRADVTHVIVCGGANDTLSDKASVQAAIQQFCTKAATYFPNARVYIGYIACTADQNKIKSFGDACGWYYGTYANYNTLGNVEYVLHNRDFIIDDQVHPNQNGCNMLGAKIRDALINGSCDVKYANLKGQLTDAESRAIKFYECIDNGIYRLWSDRSFMMQFNVAQATGGYGSWGLVNFPGGLGVGGVDSSANCATPCTAFNEGGSVAYEIPVLATLVGLNLRLNYNVRFNGFPATPVKKIMVGQFNIICPTIYC